MTTDKAPVTVEQGDRFLLVKRGLYYRPGNQGYTGIKDRAGRYPESDASPEDGITAIHEDDAPEYSQACFADLKEKHMLGKIAALEEEIKRLREALRPFARAAEIVDRYDADFPDDGACLRTSFAYWSRATGDDVIDTPRMRDLRRARTALEGGGS